LSIAMPLVGLFLIARWFRLRHRSVLSRNRRNGTDDNTRVAVPRKLPVWPLALGLFLLFWTFAGSTVIGLSLPGAGERPDQLQDPQPRVERRVQTPGGNILLVRDYGPENAPTVFLTHGWSMDNREWQYLKRDLAGQFRLIVWDLPGLGQSNEPKDRVYSLERLAANLNQIILETGVTRAMLVGHSIGGMVNLTYCRLFPERLGHPVIGIVQLNTTYTNPIHTTSNAKLSESLQKPFFEPLLHVTVFLSPWVRAMNWLANQNGLAQLQAHQSSFAGTETRAQLDFAASYNYRSSPAVVARGMLAMLHWDASEVLPRISVPVLVVTGRQDTTTLPSASHKMAETIPGAQILEVDHAAHLGPVEQHQQYDAAIRDFATKTFNALPRLLP